jgi:hypothetical protein
VDNIQHFYENSFIIIVDNNSKYLEDITVKLANYKNILFLINNTECKFELGAYKVGIQYLLENNVFSDYSFVILSQDTFVLKNKYDFQLLEDNTLAGVFVGSEQGENFDYGFCHHNTVKYFWNILDMDKYYGNSPRSFCWCCSLFLHSSKISEFLNLTKDIVFNIRNDSCASERYLWMITYRLNNNKMKYIDGLLENIGIKYNCHGVDIINGTMDSYFVKHAQCKTQSTQEE